MNKKVIWILNQTSGKLDSGWGERHYNMAMRWKKLGYKTYIFSGTYNHLFRNQPESEGNLTIEKVEEDITFCWVKNPAYKDGGFTKFWSNIVFTLRLFFISTKDIPKPDYIIVSSMPIFPVVTGSYFKKKFSAKKLIIEIRDLWPLTPIYLKGYSQSHPLVLVLKWFENFAYKKSDEIVSVLPNAHLHINPISKDASKFHYIPNGINILTETDNKNLSEFSHMLPKNKFIIGYAGTLGFANAMEYFVDATRLMINYENIHFAILGDGVLKNDLKEKLLPNQSNVTFIPKVSKSSVHKIIELFDVCYLSRFKSELYKFGVSYNKYFDYMLAKKPILESSEFINDQVEESGCGIIVEPENIEAIKEGILKFYNMTEEDRNLLGMKGYDYVKNYHNFDFLSKNYIDVFNR